MARGASSAAVSAVFAAVVSRWCNLAALPPFDATTCFAKTRPEWRQCCSKSYGPEGLAKCWDADFDYHRCCCLAPWNDHERAIPLFADSAVRVALSRSHSQSELGRRGWLRLSQEGRDDAGAEHQHRANYPSGFLWHGGYTLMRWFDCFADSAPHSWRGKRYVEFGAGIGAPGLVAAMNGAVVTMVDVDAHFGILRRNVIENLDRDAISRVKVCQLNWSRPLNHSLQQLSACENPQGGRGVAPYDIVAVAVSSYDAPSLSRLVFAVSHPGTRVLAAFVANVSQYEPSRPMPFTAPFFRRVALWSDVGHLTTATSPKITLMEFRPLVAGQSVVEPEAPEAELWRGPACGNRSANFWERRAPYIGLAQPKAAHVVKWSVA